MIRNNDILASEENDMQMKQKIGRNDLCYCGSGKKYKKCCMKKDQEELHKNNLLAERGSIEDGYLSVDEYIELSGYPLLKFDYFLLEVLNIIGDILHIEINLDINEIKRVLKEIYIVSKSFYKGCLKCKSECLTDPLRKVSLKFLEDEGYNISRLPLKLKEEKAINIFYIEFFNYIVIELQKTLIDIMDDDSIKRLSATIYFSLTRYVADNCLSGCKDACLINHDKSGYCKFCSFGRKKLPCPKKNEIDYKYIKALESDMQH